MPATSTRLAAALDISLGTVSAHLSILRDAGSIAGIRIGRGAQYRLTDKGEALIALLRA